MTATPVTAELSPRRRVKAAGFWYRLSTAFSILIAIALALTPVTAILVVGWFARMMRRETAIALCRHANAGMKRRHAKQALATAEDLAHLSRFPGWFRGFWNTLKSGLRTTFALALATLPFGAILLLAWWAGWENSFNKGYEQAWVGPLVSLLGVMIAVFVLIHLPMALAHHAAQQRLGAIWELRRVRRLIGQVRWRYLLFTLVSVILAGPLYLAQILPTFMESINPKLATAEPEEIRQFALLWHLAFTAYLILLLVVLRRWAARLYARASFLAGAAPGDFTHHVLTTLGIERPEARPRPGRFGSLITTPLKAAAWFGFIALLYIAQFANHAWWNWLNQPIIALPWIYRPF